MKEQKSLRIPNHPEMNVSYLMRHKKFNFQDNLMKFWDEIDKLMKN